MNGILRQYRQDSIVFLYHNFCIYLLLVTYAGIDFVNAPGRPAEQQYRWRKKGRVHLPFFVSLGFPIHRWYARKLVCDYYVCYLTMIMYFVCPGIILSGVYLRNNRIILRVKPYNGATVFFVCFFCTVNAQLCNPYGGFF